MPPVADARSILQQAHELMTASRIEPAIALVKRAADRQPADFELTEALAYLLVRAAKAEQALFVAERGAGAAPTDARMRLLAADIARHAKKPELVAKHLAGAVALAPTVGELRLQLHTALRRLHKHAEAQALAERTLRELPGDRDAVLTFVAACHERGDLEPAIAALREAVVRSPADPLLRQPLLLALAASPHATPEGVFAEHTKMGALLQVAAGPLTPHANTRDPDRPLRIGYLSQDFRNRSAAHFIEPILAHHDRERFHVTCYHQTISEDEMTARLKSLAHRWVDVKPLDDDALCQTVRNDGIDILVDLCGYGGGNRLSAFARKPAPVQFTYMGYANTTGLKAIDVRLVDALTDPPGADALATERLVRLEGCFLCYGPPAHAPEVAPLPAATNGYITFGSFNTLTKVTRDVVRLWARVLLAVPGSRMLVKAHALANPDAQARLGAWFAAEGIASDRVELLGETPSKADHMGMYRRVDIALDTFPYNGTTTTMEALWMGVPVVTLAGQVHISRVGVSLLTNIGHPELVAQDADGSVEIARRLAADVEALAALRSRLRDHVRSSRLCDAAGFTRRLEAVYRAEWSRWCAPA